MDTSEVSILPCSLWASVGKAGLYTDRMALLWKPSRRHGESESFLLFGNAESLQVLMSSFEPTGAVWSWLTQRSSSEPTVAVWSRLTQRPSFLWLTQEGLDPANAAVLL